MTEKPLHPLLRSGESITEALERQATEIERLQRWREGHPYSELDMDMHVEAVTKELRAEIERLRATLQSLLTDPPATLDEPDMDAGVVIKMRAIARRALEPTVEAPEMCWHTENTP